MSLGGTALSALRMNAFIEGGTLSPGPRAPPLSIYSRSLQFGPTPIST
jgi:hypothetical protein